MTFSWQIKVLGVRAGQVLAICFTALFSNSCVVLGSYMCFAAPLDMSSGYERLDSHHIKTIYIPQKLKMFLLFSTRSKICIKSPNRQTLPRSVAWVALGRWNSGGMGNTYFPHSSYICCIFGLFGFQRILRIFSSCSTHNFEHLPLVPRKFQFFVGFFCRRQDFF